MTSTISRFNYKRTRHAEMILEILQTYLQSKKMCDVVIIADIDGTKVPAHRILLSACSLYFMTLFVNAPKVVKEVHLDEVSGSALKALIEYCYTGDIEIRKDNVENLKVGAQLLQMYDVFQVCQDFLAGDLSAYNDNSKDIYEKGMTFAYQNFMQLCKTDEYLELDVPVVCKIIESDDLVVDSEECVFHSCVAWINYDRVRREQYFHQLLALIRLPLLTLNFIEDHVWPLCESRESIKLYKQAGDWHKKPDTRTQSELVTRPRKSKDTVPPKFSVQIKAEPSEETGPEKSYVVTHEMSAKPLGQYSLSSKGTGPRKTQSSQHPNPNKSSDEILPELATFITCIEQSFE